MSTKPIFAEKEDCKKKWHEIPADFSIKVGTNDKLQIAGKPVMERWETPYMQMLARTAASRITSIKSTKPDGGTQSVTDKGCQ